MSYVLLVLACIVTALIAFVFGWKKGVMYFLKSRTIGYLRVDHSDEDGPLCFMELEPNCGDFVQRDVVILKVKHEDFLPRK